MVIECTVQNVKLCVLGLTEPLSFTLSWSNSVYPEVRKAQQIIEYFYNSMGCLCNAYLISVVILASSAQLSGRFLTVTYTNNM